MRTISPRRLIWLVLITLALLIPSGYFWHTYRTLAYQSELAEARRLSAAKHFNLALTKWKALSTKYPHQGEIELQRALVAIRLGRDNEAEEALGQIPPDSPEAGPAAVILGRGAKNTGEISKAESLFQQAIRRPGSQTGEAAKLLAGVLTMQGRYQDAATTLREQFAALPDPVNVLREIHELDRGDLLVDKVRPLLKRAAKNHPEDVRVKLGMAHLELVEGNFAEADRQLLVCQTLSPNDPVVWHARLNWSIAAERPDLALQAIDHLKDGDLDTRTYQHTAVWLARQSGQLPRERQALEQLLANEPANPRALERLAELFLMAGNRSQSEAFRSSKLGVDKARERYRELIYQREPIDNARELSQISNKLGLPFEEAQWLKLAARRQSSRPASDSLIPYKRRTPSNSLASLCKPFRDMPKSSTDDTNLPMNNPQFIDLARQSGLQFRYDPGPTIPASVSLPQAMGSGIGLLDFDGDGFLDVYFTQGGTFPPSTNAPFQDRLFRNTNAGGKFEDVTEKAGLTKFPGGYGLGVAVGDYDSDGHPDLFVTRWNSYALYRNRGDGTFENRTEAAGLAGPRDWPTSAAWGDLDGDGDLDLYVCHYLNWDSSNLEEGKDASHQSELRTPLRFPSKPDHLFRNDDDRFVDISENAGIVDRDGRGLGVVIADLDSDGRPDIYVTNDMTANFFFRNNGGMKFTESGLISGLAANAEGGFQASMGIAVGDQDGDGLIDLAVTNFYLESNTLYRNLGGGLFADHTLASGMTLPTRNRLGFGVAFFDADNDGLLDLASANGHLFADLPDVPYQMAAQLLRGRRGGRVVDATLQVGPDWNVKRVGRSLAVGDLDNDGRVDLVLVSLDTPALDLRNRTPQPGHFVTITLAGSGRNRDAIGAQVKVKTKERSRVAVRYGGGSYQSSSDPRLHFGLGSSQHIETVEVTWPSIVVERFEGLTVDRGYRLLEGSGKAEPLPRNRPGAP